MGTRGKEQRSSATGANFAKARFWRCGGQVLSAWQIYRDPAPSMWRGANRSDSLFV